MSVFLSKNRNFLAPEPQQTKQNTKGKKKGKIHTLTTRGLASGNSEGLGGETNGTPHLKPLGGGTVDELRAHCKGERGEKEKLKNHLR